MAIKRSGFYSCLTYLFLSASMLFLFSGCGDGADGAQKSGLRLKSSTTWQLQLQGTINSDYDVDLYDIDLFDTPQETIEKLHGEGRTVICYFSAGSYEEWREDNGRFPKEALGKDLDGWEGERWLDIRNKTVWNIMEERIELAKRRGCDGVDPDNVNGYDNDTGFDLTAQDQAAFNKFLSSIARREGLFIGLKNDMGQIEELEPYFDFAVNEQCHEYGECDLLEPFIRNGKPVFNVEYDRKFIDDMAEREALCRDSEVRNIRTLILPLSLDDSFRISCE
ncbi:endo alpha-1,4 polygalactosaminidase precusor [Hydrogenimonas sp.]|nr:endo alpha-1,4 polygalactosaminidase precusor [Hydrogenimonas sp.]